MSLPSNISKTIHSIWEASHEHALVRLVDALGRDPQLVFTPEDVLPPAAQVRLRGAKERFEVWAGDDLAEPARGALQVASARCFRTAASVRYPRALDDY